MTRAALRGLKDHTIEKNRLRKIQKSIHEIYDETICLAKRGTESVYRFELHRSQISFYKENMKEILEGLQELFPDCSVSHTILSPGKDGKLYDISKIDDTNVRIVSEYPMKNSYIVIDWS